MAHCCSHEYNKLFQKHEEILRDILEPRFGLVETLVSRKILTSRECEDITYKKPPHKKNAKILKAMIQKTLLSDFESFRESLDETGQQHIWNYIANDGVIDEKSLIRPLMESELVRIRKNTSKLKELIDTTELVDLLWSEGVINNRMRQCLKIEADPFARNDLLLDIFIRKSYADFQRLIHWLNYTKQCHVAIMLTEDGELHVVRAKLNDDSLDKEVVNRWTEIIGRVRESLTKTEEREFQDDILEELKRRNLELLHLEVASSIKIWILCRTEVSLDTLKEMVATGDLQKLLLKLFLYLIKGDTTLNIQLQVLWINLLEDEDCFPVNANVSVNERNSFSRKMLDSSHHRLHTFSETLRQEEIISEPWYHGAITREQAEQLVTRNGDFLVRISNHINSKYVLTTFWNSHKVHYAIPRLQEGFKFYDRIIPTIGEWVKVQQESGKSISAELGGYLRNPIHRKCEDSSNVNPAVLGEIPPTTKMPSAAASPIDMQFDIVAKPRSAVSMSEGHRRILKHYRIELERDLQLDPAFMATLTRDDIITINMKELIMAEKTRQRRVSQLLDILPTRGANAFDTFKEALRESFQAGLAEMLDLTFQQRTSNIRSTESADTDTVVDK